MFFFSLWYLHVAPHITLGTDSSCYFLYLDMYSNRHRRDHATFLTVTVHRFFFNTYNFMHNARGCQAGEHRVYTVFAALAWSSMIAILKRIFRPLGGSTMLMGTLAVSSMNSSWKWIRWSATAGKNHGGGRWLCRSQNLCSRLASLTCYAIFQALQMLCPYFCFI